VAAVASVVTARSRWRAALAGGAASQGGDWHGGRLLLRSARLGSASSAPPVMAGLRGGTVRRRMGCHRGRRSAWRPWRLWSRRRAGGEPRWPMARQARVAAGMAVACCYAAQGSVRPGLRRRPALGFVVGPFVAGRAIIGAGVARGGRGVCGHGAVQVASSAGRWRAKPG